MYTPISEKDTDGLPLLFNDRKLSVMSAKNAVRLNGLLKDITFDNSEELMKILKSVHMKFSKNLVVDFIDISYTDSSGIGAMAEVARFVNANKYKLYLINVQPSVSRLLSMMSMGKIMEIHADENIIIEEAQEVDLSSFSKKKPAKPLKKPDNKKSILVKTLEWVKLHKKMLLIAAAIIIAFLLGSFLF